LISGQHCWVFPP